MLYFLKNIGTGHRREYLKTHRSTDLNTLSLSILGHLIKLSFLFPAIPYGCSVPDQTDISDRSEISLSGTKALIRPEADVRDVTVLVYQDDRQSRLDSYQHFENIPDNGMITIASTAGRRRIAVIANMPEGTLEWKDICSYEALKGVKAELEDEDRNHPLMYSECTTDTRHDRGRCIEINLKPVSSEVVIRSISCDFKGRPYEGDRILNAKAYLINVNASCSITDRMDNKAARMVNVGHLNEEDISEFRDISLITGDITTAIGPTELHPEICFRCMPNESSEDNPGTPFTRLVIEGQVEGCTYWWPIDINHKAGEKGIGRGCRYIYDIRIMRKGTTSPDLEAESGYAEITYKTTIWQEKESDSIYF